MRTSYRPTLAPTRLRGTDALPQLREEPRLGDGSAHDVAGAQLHRLDGEVHAGNRGHDHDGQAGTPLDELAKDGQVVGPAPPHGDHRRVDPRGAQRGKGPLLPGDVDHGITVGAENLGEPAAALRVFIDN